MPTQELGDGKYTIIRRLAVGGMAEIYLAEAAAIHGFRKKVVIKRILPQYANQSDYVEMFLDEARLAARLNHASIVQVFDIGQDPEGVFFTMEYVEGLDLAEILGACYKLDRQLKLEEIVAVLMPSAEALHHAHELRDDNNQLCHLIHRDVSPSNILVTNEGRVKLLDFGVAKSNDQQRATTGVSLKGKFGYMSPEQVQGHALDRRGDIFSFGVVLWELCTGRRLYPGGNDPSVLLKIINEQPLAPSTKRHDLPPELDRICLRALARNRDERYSTMQELIHDIDDVARHHGIVANSRTLSRLLDDIFPESRPTEAIAAQPHPALAAASAPATSPSHSFQSAEAQARFALPASAPVEHAREPSYPSQVPSAHSPYQPPSYGAAESFVAKPVTSKRWPVFLGGGLVVAAGVAVALLGGDGAEGAGSKQAAPVDAAKPVAGKPAPAEPSATLPRPPVPLPSTDSKDAEALAGPADSNALNRATAPSEPALASDIDAGAGQRDVVAEVPTAPAAPEAAEDNTKKERSSKSRGKAGRNKASTPREKSSQPERVKKKPASDTEKWDTNSPFAPE